MKSENPWHVNVIYGLSMNISGVGNYELIIPAITANDGKLLEKIDFNDLNEGMHSELVETEYGEGLKISSNASKSQNASVYYVDDILIHREEKDDVFINLFSDVGNKCLFYLSKANNTINITLNSFVCGFGIYYYEVSIFDYFGKINNPVVYRTFHIATNEELLKDRHMFKQTINKPMNETLNKKTLTS